MMIEIDDSVYIDLPVDRVFEFTTDVKNNTRWQSDVLLSEQISDGPVGEGATCRLVNRFMGLKFDVRGTVYEYVPGRVCAYQFSSDAIEAISRFIYQPLNGGTQFITQGRIELKGIKFAGVLARRKARKQVRCDLQKLKALLENGGH